MKIVDASAILAVLLDEVERATVEVLLANERLIAPHLLLFEIANNARLKRDDRRRRNITTWMR